MSQESCNGGAKVGDAWMFCALPRKHVGKCRLIPRNVTEPVEPVVLAKLASVEAETKSTLRVMASPLPDPPPPAPDPVKVAAPIARKSSRSKYSRSNPKSTK